MKNYLFDAFPMLCWLRDEPGHGMIEDLLKEADRKEIVLLMNLMNLGEVFYRICRSSSFGRPTP